ncbi:hypothetical protein C900_02432 [Fulvivirga imtechensis AK7]|uniref:Uncharacterized protein n=1 Tax=Fulvivirga imtechensis AK7 TaxID=1237149 RepID=L8JVI5_9BACT|nr:hypothetical protein [Fulvivirga imtechensis]ELR71624.1 hypothetical protein C900_02432 [Fulvivirga imtechensis AK7]
MVIDNLERKNFGSGKLNKQCLQFEKLLEVLRKRELSTEIITSINRDIRQINSFAGNEQHLLRIVRSSQKRILNHLEKELKTVPKNHYRNLWMVLGMSAFGLPLGMVYGLMLDNIAFFSLGLPIGMGIGTLIGAVMDKKAGKEGRQLELVLS